MFRSSEVLNVADGSGDGVVITINETSQALETQINSERKQAVVKMLKNNHGFLEYTIEDKGLLQEVSANKELDDEVKTKIAEKRIQGCLFFHITDLREKHVKLLPGDTVEFTLGTRKERPLAVDIVKIKDATPMQFLSRINKIDLNAPRMIATRTPKGPDGSKGFNNNNADVRSPRPPKQQAVTAPEAAMTTPETTNGVSETFTNFKGSITHLGHAAPDLPVPEPSKVVKPTVRDAQQLMIENLEDLEQSIPQFLCL